MREISQLILTIRLHENETHEVTSMLETLDRSATSPSRRVVLDSRTSTLQMIKGTTKDFLTKNYPGTNITREMGEFEAPLSNKKIREVLCRKDVHDWRKYVKV